MKQSKKHPLVSIGLPVYNGEKYIQQALDSLINQSYTNIEIIVSDNASNDKTNEILKKYQSQDDRIKLFTQKTNIGPAPNYKFVLERSSGDFFMWAAHDDTWDKNWVDVLLKEIRDDDFGVRGSIQFMCESRIEMRYLRDYKKNSQLAMFLGNENNYRCHYTYSLFRRKDLLACDFSALTLDYSPDNLFIFSLLRFGNFRSTKKTSMTFRIHQDNLGLQYSKQWKGVKKILYRIHPARYYKYHLLYIDNILTKAFFIALVPPKHLYAQMSYWFRGAKELVTGKRYI